jgi:hypothetical protein
MHFHVPTFPYASLHAEMLNLDNGQFCFCSPLIVCYLALDLGLEYGMHSFLVLKQRLKGAKCERFNGR